MYNYTRGFELYEVYVDWQLIILKKKRELTSVNSSS